MFWVIGECSAGGVELGWRVLCAELDGGGLGAQSLRPQMCPRCAPRDLIVRLRWLISCWSDVLRALRGRNADESLLGWRFVRTEIALE